jgi:hypothetical protein
VPGGCAQVAPITQPPWSRRVRAVRWIRTRSHRAVRAGWVAPALTAGFRALLPRRLLDRASLPPLLAGRHGDPTHRAQHAAEAASWESFRKQLHDFVRLSEAEPVLPPQGAVAASGDQLTRAASRGSIELIVVSDGLDLPRRSSHETIRAQHVGHSASSGRATGSHSGGGDYESLRRRRRGRVRAVAIGLASLLILSAACVAVYLFVF